MENLLNEASRLTPEQKMDLWHSGQRRENLNACSNEKLQAYLSICVKKNYISEADEIILQCIQRRIYPFHFTDNCESILTVLCKNLTISPALVNPNKWINGVVSEPYLTAIHNYIIDISDASSISKLQENLSNIMIIFYLAIALNNHKVIKNIQNELFFNKTDLDKQIFKEALARNIKNPEIQHRIEEIVDRWKKNKVVFEDIQKPKYTYKYEGPIKSFGNQIEPYWEGETKAVSEKKALVNLCNTYRDQTNKMKNYKLELDLECLELIDVPADDILPEPPACDKCGTRLTDGGFCPKCDDGAVDLDENVEKHSELNPKLWAGDKLKPEVSDKIIDLANDFIKELTADDIKFELADIKIVGSNCSYNYTDQSDLDVHIVANIGNLECPDNLYPSLYNAYRSLWNKNHSVKFYDIPVEIFVEVKDPDNLEEAKTPSPLKSAGIYSVLNDKWIKEPIVTEIPNIDQRAVDTSVSEWTDRYQKLLTEIKEH